MKTLIQLFVCTMFVVVSSAHAQMASDHLSENHDSASSAQPSTQSSPARQHPSLLLVVEDQHPRATISWVADGQRVHFTSTMPYTAPIGGERLGETNVRAYVALGGTRIETGAGHPQGAVIRIGITKVDADRAFFAGIDPGTEIELTIRGVRFNQPVKYHVGTGMMHLKYSLGDLNACSLPGTAQNQYLLSDPEDTLGGRIKRGINASPGALDGGAGHGSIEVSVQPDDPTLVDMTVHVPYGLLRHLQDPWESDLPGTFFEPIHFHAEAEMIKADAEPFDREPIPLESNSQTKDSSAESGNENREDPTASSED